MKVPMTQMPETQNGFCRDCSQGWNGQHGPGFKLHCEDGPEFQFWYCLWCGSNHVDIKDSDGKTVYEGGDLYQS
jgi:hypothetical protein